MPKATHFSPMRTSAPQTLPASVAAKFESYPGPIRKSLLELRELIVGVVEEEKLGKLEESLKWGEPGYSVKYGSTVRLGSSSKNADEFAVYFHCQTRLVETFRSRYGDLFRYEGNRALVFQRGDVVPQNALRECLSMALRYHKIKKDL